MVANSRNGVPRNLFVLVLYALSSLFIYISHGQDTGDYGDAAAAPPPPGLDACNGVYISYSFDSREKEFPLTKNATAQAWAFKSTATIVNTASVPLKAWQMHIGFQHREILVGANGAIVVDGDFPVDASNGTTLAGSGQVDLLTSIETAGDYTQISAMIELTGTQFGLKPPGVPMPKDIKLVNAGYKCPKATKKGKTYMHVCCKIDPKSKVKPEKKIKFAPRRYSDLDITYDVLQANGNNYQAQVTINNNNPLGRLDHWNLTWEWPNGEFIYSLRGAYAHVRDIASCVYGKTGQYYQDFDFTPVITCDRNPIIADLPAEMKNDSLVGKLPYCCRNGSILPIVMDPNQARSIFQMQVYKLPPMMNRTAIEPPRKWKINGVISPQYKCGAPVRVDPSDFPDPSGLQSVTTAVASWQINCNITRPEKKKTKCCVSFSAFYNDSVIPCNTCACGCDDDTRCNENANPMLLPAESLLVPFENRSVKAVAWARLKKLPIPNPKPCPDNCPVSINWHVNSDYKSGWTARITLFNWIDTPFQDWFGAFQIGKAYAGYENVYSFNATRIDNLNKTIFFQGLQGLNYLVGETNGTRIGDPRVPGKQQSVVSFTKKQTPGISVVKGDGFPKKVFFNGEECALPDHIPIKSAGRKSQVAVFRVIFIAITTAFAVLTTDRLS